MPKLPKTPKGWYSRDVEWCVPGRKKPIAFSTKAASDLIVTLAQEHDTIQQVHDAINYDEEARMVLQKFIELGHGQVIAKHYFK